MKSIFMTVIIAGVTVAAINCSGPQKPDPQVEACKTACMNKTELCVKKAAKNEAKKAACEAVGEKCIRDCEIKK